MLSLAFMLTLVMDPFGNLVAVNSLLAEMPPRAKRLTVIREGAIAMAILLGACFFGGKFLSTFELDQFSLRLAGGIVLFLIALGMLFPTRRVFDNTDIGSALIVPIAMPLIAGPSAISMAILFAEKHPLQLVAAAVVLATTACTILLSLATPVFSLLREQGAVALERFMGMLLILLSIQMVLDGIAAFIDSLAVG